MAESSSKKNTKLIEKPPKNNDPDSDESIEFLVKGYRDEGKIGSRKSSAKIGSRPISPVLEDASYEIQRPKRPKITHRIPNTSRGKSSEGKKDQAKLKLYLYLRNGASIESERKKMSETSVRYFRDTIKNNIKSNLIPRVKERSLSPFLERRLEEIENEADRSRNSSQRKFKVPPEFNDGEVDSRYETYNLTNSFYAPPIKAPFLFPSSKRDPISHEVNVRNDELYLSKIKIGEQKLSKLIERYQKDVESSEQIKMRITKKVDTRINNKINNVVIQYPQFEDRDKAKDIYVLKKQYEDYLKLCSEKKDQKLQYIMKKKYVKIWNKFDIDSQYSLLSKEEAKT